MSYTTREYLGCGDDRVMAQRDKTEGENLRILPVCAAEPVASKETIIWYPPL